MKYPTLAEMGTSRVLTDAFLGYNHNLRIGDGEFYEMSNMTGDNYPILSPRGRRGIYVASGDPVGIVAKDSLCYIAGDDFWMNGNKYVEGLGLTEYKDEEGKIIPKTLISMGAYVIVMPDKKYINTKSQSDFGDIDERFESNGTVSFQISRSDGSAYSGTHTGSTPPEITEEMKADPSKIPAWIDTSSVPHSLKQYSISSESWTAVATTYVKIACDNIGKRFEVNDGVTISGILDESLSALNGSFIIMSKADNFIVITGLIDVSKTQAEPITVERRMPDMDFVVESGNRLWGCRYGVQSDKVVNEIYASKLGDFKNWSSYLGTAADSYAVTVGTDGQFTGAITHLGYPIFFKEGFMHKIYGNYPSNYQVQTTACRGVQKGCERSLAIVNEVLYYKARSGVCAYDGSLPTEISGALGDKIYDSAVAGYLGNKYYISMRETGGDYSLFVYDTKKGMWHREDATEAMQFCNCRGDLYLIDRASKQIVSVRGGGTPIPNAVEWEVVSNIIGTDTPDKKYVSRIDVRMLLEIDAKVSFYIEYDSSGAWEYLYTMTGVSLKSFSAPIKTRRCDHLRLKIVGEGDAKIFSICKTIELGSEK